MRILFFLICTIVFPFGTWAQHRSGSIGHGDNPCGTDEHHTYLMKTDLAYKTRYIRQKAILDSIKRAPIVQDRQQPPVYTIPIIVHVIHLGERYGQQSNIPDEQIYDAIAGLNERFANVNGAGTDIEINFCLATRDPNGCPTSGIIRVDGSAIPFYQEEGITYGDECGSDEKAVKDLSKWPTWEYYNIWVVHDICGDIAGYAYYPNGDEYDGTVIDIVSMKYESGVLAHEVGHGLNLKHTFDGDDDGNCPLNDDCLEDGDEICDTPPHSSYDCGSSNPCDTVGEWINSRDNWMSYCFPSNDDGKFTEDQRTRMRDALTVDPRATLMLSQGCANEVAMQITSDGSVLCQYDSRVLSAVPEGGYFAIASGSGYIQGNVLTATGGNEIVVEYIIDLDSCTSSLSQVITVKPVPNSLLKSIEDTLCTGQTTILQGFPTGGTYSLISGPGSLDSNHLTAEGEGPIKLLYEKMIFGCVTRDTHVVTSFSLPDAGIELLAPDVLDAVPDTGSFQWLRCDLDYEAINNATEAIYHVFTSGNYAVVVINGICRDTSDCVAVVATGTHESTTNPALTIYPNPVKEILYLDGTLLLRDFKVALFDVRGMPMATKFNQGQNGIEIDLSGFLAGVYILQVDVKGVGRLVYRVVKV